MNKTLKFTTILVPLVLSGEKIMTWRLWDEKNLEAGDIVDFLEKETLTQFATAKLTKVVEKPLGELTEADKKGHETFQSDEKMYATYTKYYKKEVTPQTPIKIIWFELIK